MNDPIRYAEQVRTKRRISIIVLCSVLGLGVVGAGGIWVVKRAVPCLQAREYVSQHGLVAGHAETIVIGDSYSAGAGLAHPDTETWTQNIGVPTAVSAIGSTGWANGGVCGDMSYATRLNEVLSQNPDTVIVQGSQNDAVVSREEVRAAYSQILTALDGVEAIIIGPAQPPRARDTAGIAADLKAAAAEHNAVYIDLREVDLSWQEDGLHPTNEGQMTIARLVTETMGSVGE